MATETSTSNARDSIARAIERAFLLRTARQTGRRSRKKSMKNGLRPSSFPLFSSSFPRLCSFPRLRTPANYLPSNLRENLPFVPYILVGACDLFNSNTNRPVGPEVAGRLVRLHVKAN
jgi:hypothetical protein